MATKIYGSSDDLIEFEGDIYDEIGAYKAQDKGILLSDGTVLECSYPKAPGLGIWGFKLIRAGSLFDRIEECADVHIMLEQFQMLITPEDKKEFDKICMDKLHREIGRIEQAGGKNGLSK